MIDGLIVFLKALVNALPKLYGLYKKNCHEEKIIELLESYFILGSLIETGDDLLSLAREKDKIVFSELTKNELEQHYGLVQSKITIQLQRLRRLGDIFYANPTIDLLDSELKLNLKKALGGKKEGLFSLGAGLFFNSIFGNSSKENVPEDEYIARVVKKKFDFAVSIFDMKEISVSKQKELIAELKDLRGLYRKTLDNLTEPEHKTFLAYKAKEFADQYSLRK